MKTPITLITGYLGAGKTTLLRHVIENAGQKMAVLMNEFGQISIDSAIVRGKNINMIELKGGCVCCSLTGEFEAALKEIKEKIKPELIVIETTGVAEPDAIVGDLSGIDGVRLDAVVTVVDVDSMIRFPSIGFTGKMQIEMADIILLNKTDMVSGADIEKVEKQLREINSKAKIVRAVRCDVDLELILDVNLGKKTTKQHDHRDHIKEAKLGNFIYESEKKLSREGMESLMIGLPEDIIRAKGFVITDQGTFLVNFVFGRLDFEDFETEKNELVFIGKNIEKHKKKILKELGKCEIK